MAEKKEATRVVKKPIHAKKHPIVETQAPPARTVNIYDLEGKVDHSVELPAVFMSEFRPDLVMRAVTASRANRRQAYGSGRRSGMRHSVRWSGKGQGVSRVPRIRGTMIGAQAPGTRGGRRAGRLATTRGQSITSACSRSGITARTSRPTAASCTTAS